ncbi:MAG: hypothetical protein K0S05_2325 [Agromyces sp.]|nr:hypothetical protein [Agromyces sp.]
MRCGGIPGDGATSAAACRREGRGACWRQGNEVDASEDRIGTLQRIAYGADATDAERARAVAELATLATPDRHRDAELTDVVVPAPGGQAQHPDASASSRTAGGSRLIRWSAAAGLAGLLLGATLGWVAGRGIPTESAAPTPTAPLDPADPGTPLEDTELLAVFDRLPPAATSEQVARLVDVIDPESVRLLATRVDGPAAYLARTVDGEDVCLVLVLPDAPTRSECTVDGHLPAGGLSILYGAQAYGLSAALLDPTGTVSLGPVTF